MISRFAQPPYREWKPAIEVHADPRATRGLPGSRIPYFWLERNGNRVSTTDLTGRWLMLARSGYFLESNRFSN